MTDKDTNQESSGRRRSFRILLASLLCLFLYGSFFFYLVRGQLSWMIRKQTALESIKVLTVPGSNFLNNLGWLAPLDGSLFYTILLGIMFLVFLLLSLVFASLWKRFVFLFIGFLALTVLSFGDGVWVLFSAVLVLSFGSFFALTFPCQIRFDRKETAAFILMVACICLSLFFGAKEQFFLKTRDKVLFDSALGNKIVSYYYQYSPLAASLITPEKGIYQGVLFDPGIQDGKVYYLGQGVFVAGNPAISAANDFTIAKQGTGFSLESRHGKKISVGSMTPKEIENAILSLFDMKGFVLLNKIGLYVFPGALLILITLGIRWFTSSRKVFVVSLAILGLVMVSFIWIVSLTGNRIPTPAQLSASEESARGLDIAYYLDRQKEIPASFIPAITETTRSSSPALRYWGARLLGVCGAKEEVGKVTQLLEDPVPNVGYTAAQALYNLTKTENLNSLIPRLVSDPSWYVRCKVYSIFLQAGALPSPA
jgi:hypothetical protein